MNTPISITPLCYRAIYWFVLLCAVVDRVLLLTSFGFKHTGTDDVIFWDVAKDMARGIFREPFLYGQNYNPAIESLLAVPLLWASVPMHLAMPISTSVLALIPFFSFAIWHARRQDHLHATLFAAMPLLLPVEWGIMSMVSRGFINGLALLAFLPWLSAHKGSVRSLALTGAVLYAALLANPNAVLFAVPFALWTITRSGSTIRNALLLAAGALPVMILHVLAIRFYAADPLRIVHRVDDWRLTFHPGELIPEALLQLDRHFAWLMPLYARGGPFILAILLGIVLWMIRIGKRKEALALATFFPIILLSFAFPKIHDGFDNVFFPFSRMFLALPLLLAWSITLLPFKPTVERWAQVILLLLAPLFLFVKMQGTSAIVEQHMTHQEVLPVREAEIAPLREDLARIMTVVQDHDVDLIVTLDGDGKYRSQLITYAGHNLAPGLPPTLYVGVDRRYWRRLEEAMLVRSTILFIGGEYETWDVLTEEHPWVSEVGDPAGRLHILQGNVLAINDVLALLGRSLHHSGPVTPRSRSTAHHPPAPPPPSTSGTGR